MGEPVNITKFYPTLYQNVIRVIAKETPGIKLANYAFAIHMFALRVGQKWKLWFDKNEYTTVGWEEAEIDITMYVEDISEASIKAMLLKLWERCNVQQYHRVRKNHGNWIKRVHFNDALMTRYLEDKQIYVVYKCMKTVFGGIVKEELKKCVSPQVTRCIFMNDDNTARIKYMKQCRVFEEPAYVKGMYEAIDSARRSANGLNCNDSAYESYLGSFVTNNSPKNVVDSVMRLCTVNDSWKVCEKLYNDAVKLVFNYNHIPIGVAPIPDIKTFMNDLLNDQMYPHLNSTGPMEDTSIEGRMKDRWKPVQQTVHNILTMLLRYYDDYKDDRSNDFLDLFPPCIADLLIKTETKGPQDDKDKARIFFAVSKVDYFIAKYAMLPYLKVAGCGPGIGIGFNWHENDAQRLYNTLVEYSQVICIDIRGFDFHVKSVGMAKLTRERRNIYKWGTGSKLNEWILDKMHTYVEERNKVTYVYWGGDHCRRVEGMMISGKLDTSVGDCEYAESMVFTAMLKYPKYKEYIKAQQQLILERADVTKIDVFLLAYGDNLIVATRNRMMEILSLSYLKSVFKDNFDMETKDSETFVAEKLLCDPNKITGKELTWLKRKFVACGTVDGVVMVQPYKMTSDVQYKYGRSHNDITDPAVNYIRLKMLLQDSFYTNKQIIADIEVALEYLRTNYPDVERDAYYIEQNIDMWPEFKKWVTKMVLRSGSSSCEEYRKKIAVKETYTFKWKSVNTRYAVAIPKEYKLF